MVDSTFFNRDQNNGGRLTGIGAIVKTVVAQNALQKGLAAHQAIDLWPSIAGEQLAKVCSAESIRDGVLFVKAKSSAWTNELTFHKPELLKRLASRIGEGNITDIRFSTNTRGRTAKPKTTPGHDSTSASMIVSKPKLSLTPIDPASAADLRVKLKLLIERNKTIVQWRRENGWLECQRCRALYDPDLELNDHKPVSSAAASMKKNGSNGLCGTCQVLTNS